MNRIARFIRPWLRRRAIALLVVVLSLEGADAVAAQAEVPREVIPCEAHEAVVEHGPRRFPRLEQETGAHVQSRHFSAIHDRNAHGSLALEERQPESTPDAGVPFVGVGRIPGEEYPAGISAKKHAELSRHQEL